MSRKDYRLIAGAIRECVDIYGNPCWKTVVDNIAYNLKKDNINFDKDRFLSACGFPMGDSISERGK